MLRFDNKTPYIKQTKMDTNKLKIIAEKLNQVEKIWLNGYLTGSIENSNSILKSGINADKVEIEDSNPILKSVTNKTKVKVFYGTETGNSKQIALQIVKSLNASAFSARMEDLEIYKPQKLAKEERAIFIISTHGEGEFPEPTKEFYEYLKTKKLVLEQLNYAVIALGDSAYPLFCHAGKELDKQLLALGANNLIQRADLDLDYADHIHTWLENFIVKVTGSNSIVPVIDTPKTVNIHKLYQGEIIKNIVLNDIGSEFEVRHIEIMPDEEVAFQPGDSISITFKSDDEYIRNYDKNYTNLAPRLYSIASSKEYHDGEIHLTVKLVQYKDEEGNLQKGLCSSFLANLEEGKKIEFSIKPNHNFRLPDSAEEKDIILIGPGTGIAPFRSFLAERSANSTSGKNWLFFGNQRFQTDFLYQTEIQDFVKEGLLDKVSLAFSRDQEQKVYVQHKMEEEAEELFNWLQSGAKIYVCGDKNKMAKDVEATLLKIITTQGKISPEKSKEYLYEFKQNGQYLKDVY